MSNIAIHLSRHRKAILFVVHTMRPAEGQRSKDAPPAHHPAVSRSVVAAIFLLLAGMSILPFFKLHSGSISVITFRSAGH